MKVTFKLFLWFVIVAGDFFICGTMRIVPEVVLGTVILRVLKTFRCFFESLPLGFPWVYFEAPPKAWKTVIPLRMTFINFIY